jgi:hypothetical protein
MGKAKDEPSMSAWFRTTFGDRPDLVKKKGSNEEIERMWRAAHPGRDFSKRHRQAMANVKSALKKSGRKGKRRAQQAEGGGMVQAARPVRSSAGGSLEHLEESIDRCLSTARSLLDRDPDIHQVVRHLRMARNELILIGGKN